MPEHAIETTAAMKRSARNPEPTPHAHMRAYAPAWDAGVHTPGAPSAVLAIQRTAGNQAVMRMLDAQRPGQPLAGPSTAVQRISEDDELEDDVQRATATLHEPSDEAIRSAAAEGIRTPATTLPHLDRIQASFGRHSVAHIQAHVGPEAARASRAMNALAYASGNHVVFGATPDLRIAAHEAAHIVQQQGGVQLSGGIGRAGDPYERHADAVADAVVAGRSAEGVLEVNAARGRREKLGLPQRSPDTALLASQSDQIFRPVQRVVSIFSSKNGNTEMYYSDKAPGTLFKIKEQAEEVDRVMEEIIRLRRISKGQLAQLPPETVARLQTVFSNDYPSWVPQWMQEKTGVMAKFSTEVANFAKRKYIRKSRLPNKSEALKCCDELAGDGYKFIDIVKNGINSGTGAQAAGHCFAVEQMMIARSRYELRRVEPEYGIRNPETRRRFRADAELLCVDKQSPRNRYYPSKDEKFSLKVVEYKLGYHETQLLNGKVVGLYEDKLREQFNRYAGVGSTGGLDRGPSQQGIKPRKLEYVWYKSPPDWIRSRMPNWLRDAQKLRDSAFAGGLALNGKAITPSSEEPITTEKGIPDGAPDIRFRARDILEKERMEASKKARAKIEEQLWWNTHIGGVEEHVRICEERLLKVEKESQLKLYNLKPGPDERVVQQIIAEFRSKVARVSDFPIESVPKERNLDSQAQYGRSLISQSGGDGNVHTSPNRNIKGQWSLNNKANVFTIKGYNQKISSLKTQKMATREIIGGDGNVATTRGKLLQVISGSKNYGDSILGRRLGGTEALDVGLTKKLKKHPKDDASTTQDEVLPEGVHQPPRNHDVRSMLVSSIRHGIAINEAKTAIFSIKQKAFQMARIKLGNAPHVHNALLEHQQVYTVRLEELKDSETGCVQNIVDEFKKVVDAYVENLEPLPKLFKIRKDFRTMHE